MKKLISIALLLCLPFTFISCSNEDKSEETTSNTQTEESSSIDNEDSSEKDSDENKKENDPENIVKLYYFNSSSKKIYYIEENVDKKSESAVEDIYNLLRKSPSSELTAPISQSSIITLAEQYTYPDTAFIAFKKDFIETQGFSGEDEKLALQCIAYTYANFFGSNVTKAIITLEGHPYKNSGVKIDENHPIPVDTTGIEKFQE